MRVVLYLFVCLCPFLMYAEQDNESKIYLHEEEILLDHNKIFVRLNNDWLPFTAIRVDEGGYYITKSDLEGLDSIYWVCKRCETKNFWGTRCKR